MDLKDSLKILCSPGKGYSQSSISLEFSDEFCMKSHPLHASIETEWKKKLKESINLFNASKFRLHRIIFQQAYEDHSYPLKLYVGTTSYKDFIGTNCAPYAHKLVQDGLEKSNSQLYLSDPIGVGGLLVTSDDQLVFIKRSEKCAEMPGLIDRPGGHPEPSEVQTVTGQSLKDVDPSAIVEEIFQSVLKEIRDEVNIPVHELSQPILLGVGYNPNTWKRPSMEFYVRCNLSSDQVAALYKEQTQAESDESTEILIVPVAEVLKSCLENFKYFNKLTHPAKTALYFLKIFFK
ncbi:hypothetical protein JTE90_007465 [Oedothorax gibbosus]|uniref:Nudix hydrolase domain-containing protein n=1 Tax=Oedothorax gibbosus TaxID=931172 RepID=A0AAV6U8C9_9ARAC|nr:hypothetical protein JTE90_007465 [Oedothorax gibbosus]